MTEIRAVNVGKSYKIRGNGNSENSADDRELLALDQINLHVKAGEFLVIIGPSGCGKSTFLDIVGGLSKPDNGEILIGDGWSMRVRLDEEALKAIAKTTDAEYFYAATADDLKKVYDSLNSKLVFETRDTEITSLFAAVAAALAVVSALLSMVWFNRVL